MTEVHLGSRQEQGQEGLPQPTKDFRFQAIDVKL